MSPDIASVLAGLRGDDGWTELYDADIARVDLVGKGANGMPFLLVKSDGGLLAPDTIRHLINKESDVATKSKPDTMAVFDANGNMVGLCAVDDLQPVAQAPGSDSDAAARRVQANASQQQPQADAQLAEAAQGVTKALDGAAFGDIAGNVKKTTAGGGTIDDSFAAVLKSIDPLHAGRLKDATGHLAAHASVTRGVPVARAVQLAKTAAIKAALTTAAHYVEPPVSDVSRRLGRHS